MATINPGQPAFHGYAPTSENPGYRPPLAIVISRETGARGRSIAERVAELLGWGYLDQESLEYLTQGPPAGNDGRDANVEPVVNEWIDQRLQELNRDGALQRTPQVTSLFRRILEASTAENCVILARGAGRCLPDDARLHVKIVSPLETRIAYIGQLNRLSPADARQFIVEKDRSREEFLAAKLGVDTSDISQYDLVVNTSQFGVESAAQLIVTAAREKDNFLRHELFGERTWRVGMPE
jgi:cytidylate kinase